MKTYQFRFLGKTKGAIGAMCGYSKDIDAKDIDEAIERLYDTHEHIVKLEVWNEELERWDYARYRAWAW